ncbi:MAG: hypothetical protein K2G44_06305 [Clostridia bacterium]|nr:hypothetical protein [Clostridia bacterium]
MENFKKAAWETGKAALCYAAFSLFALAIIAAIVKACTPSDAVIRILNWVVKCIGAFVFPFFFIRKDRALVKGIAAGILGVILTMFLFAAIGGGFHITWFFPLELLVCGVLGGAGALLGTKVFKR